jgi:hypothetical protein
MANALYKKYKQACLEGAAHSSYTRWLLDDIKMVMVHTASYTVDLVNHQFLSDLGGIVATSPNLSSKGSSQGVATCADINFGAVSGSSVQAYVLYHDTGVAGTSPLIAYIDTATGLPFTPSGAVEIVTFSTNVFTL